MAEVAGLVMSSVGLATLFGSAISCFDAVQLGRDFERDFAIYHFRLEDARTRLYRWGKAIDAEDQDSAIHVLGAERFRQAEDRLNLIKTYFEEAEHLSSRYNSPTLVRGGMASSKEPEVPKEVERTRTKLRKLYPPRNNNPGLVQRAVWALHGERTFKNLMDKLGDVITGLELLVPERGDRIRELASIEISEINDPQSLFALLSATTPGASDNVSIQDNALRTTAEENFGHIFERNETFDNARVKMGDRIFAREDGSANEQVYGPRHEFKENKTSGDARVRMGNEINVKGKDDDFWK